MAEYFKVDKKWYRETEFLGNMWQEVITDKTTIDKLEEADRLAEEFYTRES